MSLKQWLINCLLFVLIVLSASLVSGTYFYVLGQFRKAHAVNSYQSYSNETCLYSAAVMLLFAFFAVMFNNALKMIWALKYRLPLAALCIIGFIASLGGLLLPLRAIGYKITSLFDAKAWGILLLFALLQGIAIAVSTIFFKKLLNRTGSGNDHTNQTPPPQYHLRAQRQKIH